MMKNKMISYLNGTHGFKTARRGIVLALTLALLSYNFGSGVLQSLGATGTDAPICGLEEHMHTQDCYTSVLACDHTEGPDGSAPIHDGTCYISQAICGMTEHVHTDECYAEAVENTVSGSDARKSLSLATKSNDGEALEIDLYADQADSMPLYVNTSYGLVNPDTATNMYNGNWDNANSPTNRYVLFVKDKIELFANGDLSNPTWTIKTPNGAGGDPNFKTDDTGTTATYLATTPGDYEITLEYSSGEDSPSNESSTFYFVVKYPIYVETKLGEVHKDRVHEYLDVIHGGSKSPRFITNSEGKALYVKNAKAEAEWQDSYPYTMYVGDEVVLTAYYVASSSPEPPVFKVSEDSADSIRKVDSTAPKDVKIEGVAFKKVTAIFKAENEKKNACIEFGDETFYIYIKSSDYVHHFDIEIVDGGTYTDKITTVKPDGSTEIATTVYTAFVNNVNHCYVYGANNTVLTELDSGDYFPHGDEGNTQYEITSAYDKDDNQVFRDIEGATVERVEFDIEIRLVPQSRTITTRENGEQSVEDLSHIDEIIIPSTIYEMESREILDALNKCPGHNGLDFTIRSNGDLIKVDPMVTKTLNGAVLTQNQFEFELYDKEYDEDIDPIRQAKNDQSGNANFETLYFSSDDASREFTYYIKEVNNNKKYITYDTTIYKMMVKLDKNSDNGEIVPIVTYECSLDGGNSWKSYNGTPKFTNTDKTPTPAEVELKVLKTLVNADGSKLILTPDQFSFELRDAASGAIIDTAKNDKDGNVTFEKLTFTSEDLDNSTKYDYFIKETTGTEKNIKYDTTIYRVTVNLSINSDEGKIVPTVTYARSENGTSWPTYTGALEFVNTDTTPVEVTPLVHKTLLNSNRSRLNLKQGQFTFVLWAASDPNKESAITATNDQNGNVSFGTFKYSSEDFDKSQQYVYYIKEIAGTDENIIYDTTTYRMTVTLTKNEADGKIVPTVTYARAETENSTSWPTYTGTLEFVNTDTSTLTPATVTPTVHKRLENANGYQLNLNQKQFQFGLYTDLSRSPVETVWSDRNGNAVFTKLTFNSDDLGQSSTSTRTYYIQELNDQQSGIKYDTTIYRMTVTLSRNTNAGKIDSSVRYSYSTNGGNTWNSYNGTPEFVNVDTAATVDVTVDVVWDDDGNKNRPDSVVIQLLKDGVVYDEVTLSKSNNWHYTWKSLDGNVEWSVQEVNLPDGYTATYDRDSQNKLHFIVTNRTSLPQTGQLNWPIPVLFGCGLILITLGSIWERSGRKKESDEN